MGITTRPPLNFDRLAACSPMESLGCAQIIEGLLHYFKLDPLHSIGLVPFALDWVIRSMMRLIYHPGIEGHPHNAISLP
jgi:hypothetical protein